MVRKSNAMERKVGSAGESAHPEAKSLATKRYTLHKRLNMLQTGREAKPGRALKKETSSPQFPLPPLCCACTRSGAHYAVDRATNLECKFSASCAGMGPDSLENDPTCFLFVFHRKSKTHDLGYHKGPHTWSANQTQWSAKWDLPARAPTQRRNRSPQSATHCTKD